ncbi:MAG: O-acetylhomoserine aminocarboxypropyltransferase/cysteine synthase family protein [Clostridia bacterium]|nr:O-acetylhomoserine aminocarboxypropyltransferase/cysteine synthase family protein [Clostridia bacterium]
MKQYQLETKCVQSGYEPQNGEPRVVPICQSTTFKYESSDAMGDLFDLKADGFFYTRLANPTTDAVERKIADLEGGVGAMLTSSGQSAVFSALFNICKSGDHIISISTLYGGTFNLLNKTLREMGIEVTFVDPDASEQEIEALFRSNTKAVFGETLTNPSLVVMDIEKFAHLAHAHHVPLIVDNTFPTPIHLRPIEFGADIVVHSTTKYMDGHAVAVGGVVVDSGNFDWSAGDYPQLTQPDESYHGIVYTQHFGKMAYIAKAKTHLMRDLGFTPSPNNAFLLNLGLETLHLRMKQHAQNAQKIAEFLEQHPKVSWVNYPGLPSNQYYQLAQKYMPNGTCGVISFGVAGGRKAAVTFMEALKIAAIVTHVADARTCVLHPASSTHRQMNDDELKAAGVSPDLIRMSVGIESAEDLIADISAALDTI